MSDPRNAAHDRKVAEEKKHKGTAPPADGAAPVQPGKKARKKAPALQDDLPINELTPGEVLVSKPSPTLEGSQVVLAQLKDIAFHSHALVGKLAELMLTVEDKLKQKEQAVAVGDVYSAQDVFHTKLTALIESYSAECDRLQTGSE